MSQFVSAKKTGLIFDDRMAQHYSPWDPDFIENPNRYLSSLQRCKDYNLLSRCHIFKSRLATEEELMLVHDKHYIDGIKSTKAFESSEEFEKYASKFDSVYFNNSTFDCALLSAGCTLELVSNVLKGTVSNGMAIVRPPGHHAMEKDACGFCYFNNVAIAAKHALEKFNLKRILIVDWDVHHGQATQQAFYGDSRVLYFSIHRYEDGKFWPYLRESNFDYTGQGAGKGYTINVPLNLTAQGNSEYLAIFNNVLLPVAYEFSPELILISAGFDAALGCPEGEMVVYPQAYPHFLNSLSPLADGKICVILEGGYCIPSLSESVALCLRGLLGDPCPSIPPCLDIQKSTANSIMNSITIQSAYWSALRLQSVYNPDDDVGDIGVFDETKHIMSISYSGNPLEGLTVFDTRNYYPLQQPHVKDAYAHQINKLICQTDLSVPASRTIFYEDFSNECENMYADLTKSGVLSKDGVLVMKKETGSNKNVLNGTEVKLPEEILNSLLEHPDATKKRILSDGLFSILDFIVNKKCQNGFAVIAPRTSLANNSIYYATTYLLEYFKLQRILIIDWGMDECLQSFFSDDHRVLYASLSGNGKEEDIGNGLGRGYTFNIPISGSKDGDYLAAFFHLILPIAYEYAPEFILVAYGPNSSHVLLSSVCFGICLRLLSSLCCGKLAVAFERGVYAEHLHDIPTMSMIALTGEKFPMLEPCKPFAKGINGIQKIRKIQKRYWKCLKFDKILPNSPSPFSPNSSTSKLPYYTIRRPSNPVAIPCSKDTIVKPKPTRMWFIGDYVEEECFCVTPLESCQHLELLQPLPREGLDLEAPCSVCDDRSENWVCLHCYQVYCGRFVNAHMLKHGTDMGHYLTLSYSDLSVWCYACDAYIHNSALTVIKEHACERKFKD